MNEFAYDMALISAILLSAGLITVTFFNLAERIYSKYLERGKR
jgi:hypothetical protein